ncbi:MAG: FKBP-type peptidyl-prolyl cis-trans isomerase [Bacteroidales bacterium]|jgi:FKBP-type peptidyl-prolyl cis-trans isomerase FklB|nr:FKBP-type peptidyl-prolyl cis-trans isomerase [Bacteroidales bacterium]
MTQEEKKSYALGIAVGINYRSMNFKVDEQVFAKGVSDALNGRKQELSDEEITQIFTQLQAEIEEQELARRAVEMGEERTFLEANRQKPGVRETASGLQYKIITESIGKKPVATDIVEVHYHGQLIDGTVFDSSVARGSTMTFPLNQVIQGWTEGLQLMSEGSKFEFYIPSHLAYGDRDMGVIKPYSTLIFEIELFKVN